MSPPTANRIAIVGGGVSGLSAALRILDRDPSTALSLFEAGDRLGGVVQTTRLGGYLIEHGADMFTIRDPWAIDLCHRIGFADQLIETDPRFRRAFIVHQGKLCSIPDGFTLMRPTRFLPLAASRLLSWKGKLRVGWEYFVPRRTSEQDESLAEFARRRLGTEAYERLVQPLIGGIFTADPERLSMQAALPQFVEMERKQGGLIRAALRAPRQKNRESGARYGTFRAARGGMGSFVEALAGRLPAGVVRLRQPVTDATRTQQGTWQLRFGDGRPDETFDGLLLALPAHRAAELLGTASPALSAALGTIDYAGVAVVAAGFRRDQIAHPLDGFGCVAPLRESRQVLSISFSSVKFSGRAPADRVLLRAFIGGACQPELLEKSDEELKQIARQEMQDLLGARGEPELCELRRWQQAMPQYHLGHLEKARSIAALAGELPRLQLAGNGFDGVGIPNCVRRGEQAADAILNEMEHQSAAHGE